MPAQYRAAGKCAHAYLITPFASASAKAFSAAAVFPRKKKLYLSLSREARREIRVWRRQEDERGNALEFAARILNKLSCARSFRRRQPELHFTAIFSPLRRRLRPFMFYGVARDAAAQSLFLASSPLSCSPIGEGFDSPGLMTFRKAGKSTLTGINLAGRIPT